MYLLTLPGPCSYLEDLLESHATRHDTTRRDVGGFFIFVEYPGSVMMMGQLCNVRSYMQDGDGERGKKIPIIKLFGVYLKRGST